VTQDAARLASLKALQIEHLVEGTRQILVALSNSRDVRDGDTGVCSAYLRQVAPQFASTHTNFGVLDPAGTLVCSAFTTPSASLADRSYFQRAVSEKRFVVGEYIVGRQTGRAALPLAQPLVSTDGGIQRVAFATIDLERLTSALGVGDWPQDSEILVTDRKHTVIAMYPGGQQVVGRSLSKGPLTRLIGAGLKGTVDHDENGVTETVAFERVRPLESGLLVRVQIVKTHARAAAAWEMYQSLLGFSLVAIIVIIGVNAASDRLLMKPIAQLTDASRRLASGDLGARVASSTTIPELHELGKGFDAMATVLEDREAARLRAEIERKDLERQYHQAQKMDAVGRLAGGIAHDFNNLLMAMFNYLALANNKLEKDHVARTPLTQVQEAANRAATLTRQLLAFSRKQTVQPRILCPRDIVAGIEPMLQRVIGRDVQLRTDLAADTGNIRADPTQIEQIIMNLVVNARDAMPRGGTLTIATENITLDETYCRTRPDAAPGPHVAIAVTDTGEGMSTEVLERLFEPFFTTKEPGKGTGLGLATCHGIVRQCGGHFDVRTAVGRGTSMRVLMPSAPNP
jgi:signal transduction histidine kinase